MADARATPSTPRPFRCSSCDKGFTRQENLKRHINTHHRGLQAPSFKCTQCDARFARSDLRKRHVENCHVSSYTSPPKPSLRPPPLAEAIQINSPTPAWLDTLMSTSTEPSIETTAPLPRNLVPPMPMYDQHPIQMISGDSHCVEAFFSSFHGNFPALHEASFHVISAPAPLLNVITCIGSHYCQSTYNDTYRKSVFESTLTSMQKYVEQNRSRYQETWVLQTFLLLEFLGIYGGDDGSFLKAQRIHRDLVDAMRMLQMSHDGASSYFDDDSSDETEEEYNVEFEDGPVLNMRWQEFIKKESRKRCIYCLYLLDSQFSIVCNLRPMLSSLEIKYELPCSESLWFAKTASAWSNIQKSQFRSFDDADDQGFAPATGETPPSQGFFYEASQSLLHSDREKKKPRKLRLLWASPFAAVILVTQLQMMARELTHASCLLERPKAQRRTLSVLTDKQHAQISQALKGIAELVPRSQRPVLNFMDFRQMDAAMEPQEATPLWHTFWVLWYYTSITLSHPDSLLVGGIVESNLPLAIATAGHLATPRSKDKRDIYEDSDVFRILNDLELALEMLSPLKSTSPPLLESPFITLIGFKICLVGWRLVRLTMVEARHNRSSRSNPCKFVLDAIMTCVDLGEDILMDEAGKEGVGKEEVRYLEWIVGSFKKRTCWKAGEWVAAVMEESAEKAREVWKEGYRVGRTDFG